jgi:hypothetical protein
MMKIDFPEGTGKFSGLLTAVLFRFIDFLDINNETITTYRIKKLRLSNSLDPKNSNHRNLEKEIGILLQGPIYPVTTFRICERYKALYPKVKIVFSTWNTESSDEISRIRQLGIHVIENEIPQIPGPSNINLQIASTKSGIDYLSTFPITYVLKNRSDCWLSSDFFLEYFRTLIAHYSNEDSRLIVPSYNSFLFRLYSPSDQIQFGRLETLKFYWDCPLVDEKITDFRFSESYLVRSMLERQGLIVQNNIQESLAIYRDKFIFADNEQLGFVLNKGSKNWPGNRWAPDGYPQPMSEIQFWIWLELQAGMEKILLDYEALPSHGSSESVEDSL